MSAQRIEREGEEYKEDLPGEENYEEVVRRLASASPAKKPLELPQQVPGNIPEAVDGFLRNYLRRAGLSQTLMVFEVEWTEKLLRNTQMKATEDTGFSCIDDAPTHGKLLQGRLDTVRREAGALGREVLVAGEKAEKMRREMEFYRLQCRRAAEDKSKLTEDIKQLNKHLASYEQALRLLDDKYQNTLRQKSLISCEKDRLRNTLGSKLKQENLQSKTQEGSNNTGSSRQSLMKRYPKDSEFPQLAPIEGQRWKNPDAFSLFCSIGAHKRPISCISLHPQKPMLASASDDGSWRLWALPADGEKVGQMLMTGEGHSDWLSGCSFHPDGSKLATTSGDTTVRLWDLSLGCCVATLSGHSQPTWGCSFHSRGHLLASCSADRTAKLWDLNSQRCRLTLRRHAAPVNSVCFLASSSDLLLTCSADRTLALWDARRGTCTVTFCGHQHPCNHSAFSQVSDLMASCDTQGVINLWDIKKPQSPVATLDVGPLGANQVAFSPSANLLAVASSDGSVRLVETNSCDVTSLRGHSKSVQSVTFDQTGETMVSAGSDGLVNVWS